MADGDTTSTTAEETTQETTETTALEIMRAFIATFPEWDVLSQLTIDYTDKVPDCAGLFPNGLVEISRTYDILGAATVLNQYNFALYTVMEKAPNEDAGATTNAEWTMHFQEWVQEMSTTHQAPTFGDEPLTERMTAQNGAIYSADDEGTAVYVIQMSATFTKNYQ